MYGLRVSKDVNVDVAMIPVKRYFVTGVFLKPGRVSLCHYQKREHLQVCLLTSCKDDDSK